MHAPQQVHGPIAQPAAPLASPGAAADAPLVPRKGGREGAVDVRRATARDVPALTGVLARAFDDDPVLNWVLRHDARRGEAIRRFFEICLRRLTLPHGEVYTTADLTGAALWTPPGKWKQGLLAQVLQLPDWVRVAGPTRVPKVLGALAGLLRQHPHAPHFYLFELGVDPPFQGRGLGSALLRPVLDRCDRDRIPAYLENTNERNVPVYERHGFRVTAEVALAGGGPRLWLMWRDPR